MMPFLSKNLSRSFVQISINSHRVIVQPAKCSLFTLRHLSYANKQKNQTLVKQSFYDRILGYDSNEASKEFKSRWLMAIPAFSTHMCIGSPWAWSIMADTLTRQYGIVSPAAADWTLMEAALPLSLAFLTQGLAGALLGSWQLRVGPRKSMALAAVAFGGGLVIGSAGIYMHSLPALYLGYGFLGGLGIGLAYTPPVQNLIHWFPDRKGIASGLAVAGFGSGALVFTPAVQMLMAKFAKVPQYLGSLENNITETINGKLFADVNGKLVEVVLAGPMELSKLSTPGLSDGLYIVGTGSTGAVEALAIMGVVYFSIMLASSLATKTPHPSYLPKGYVPPEVNSEKPNISLQEAVQSPQFYLLGVTFFCLAAGGMGMFSVAKPMMSEVFSSALPDIVTSSFSSQYLLMLSAGNLGGRLAWAAISDVIGRRTTFFIFTLGSVPLYFALPSLISAVVNTQSMIPLTGFISSTVFAITIMGGMFAILPAYEADLFGSKFVGAIHGRMLVFNSAAALLGPYILIKLRSESEKAAIAELISKIPSEKFEAVFHVSIDKASELIAAKTLSIGKLLALAPPGTLDPSPHLYDSTMYTLCGFMVIAVVAHGLVKPVKAVITLKKSV